MLFIYLGCLAIGFIVRRHSPRFLLCFWWVIEYFFGAHAWMGGHHHCGDLVL